MRERGIIYLAIIVIKHRQEVKSWRSMRDSKERRVAATGSA